MISLIIPMTDDEFPALLNTLESLQEGIDEVIIPWAGSAAMQLGFLGDKVQVHPIPMPDTSLVAMRVSHGLHMATGDWIFVLFPGEQFALSTHVACSAVESMRPSWSASLPFPPVESRGAERLAALVAQLDPSLRSMIQPVLWTEDKIGHKCLTFTHECRAIRGDLKAAVTWGRHGFEAPTNHPPSPIGLGLAPLTYFEGLPILKQTMSALQYETSNFESAMKLAAASPLRIDKRYFIKARAKLDQRSALNALRALYEHMSLHEEPGRLLKIFEALPYTLEGLPEVEAMRAELKGAQLGHLLGANSTTTEEAWYRDGSPGEVISDSYVQLAHIALAPRLLWLGESCIKEGFKRVAEFGSIDGTSLFPLMKIFPDIEWHGVEVNPIAVAHGRALATRNNVNINLHNATFQEFAKLNAKSMNAVSVFEVLEHNFDPTEILNAAEATVIPGGRVYITTPCGSWSLHDESCRQLALRKDHINVYTVDRMRRMLEARGAADIQVREIENPSYWEANSWVFASYRVNG